jgi:1-acyl-sn-glycerol-3-phosphate acyltransferase
MRPLGAHGVDRTKTTNGTDAMSELFKVIPKFILLIAPEGTRKPVTKWKTGFYVVAQKAKVPLALGFIDWKKKEFGVGKLIWPTELEKDMRDIMEFYQHIPGRIPENFQIDGRFTP